MFRTIYKAYFAKRNSLFCAACGAKEWETHVSFFENVADAETHLMNLFVQVFRTIEIEWFMENGFSTGVDDTYDAYCDVLDHWLKQQPVDVYDYCIQEITVK